MTPPDSQLWNPDLAPTGERQRKSVFRAVGDIEAGEALFGEQGLHFEGDQNLVLDDQGMSGLHVHGHSPPPSISSLDDFSADIEAHASRVFVMLQVLTYSNRTRFAEKPGGARQFKCKQFAFMGFVPDLRQVLASRPLREVMIW